MTIYTRTDIPLTQAEAKNERIKGAIRQFLAAQQHSHFVTLNFHRPYTCAATEQKLRLWTLNALNRLFDSAEFAGVNPEAVLRFTAFPELTRTLNPHFHLLLYVDPSRAEYFERIAAQMWKTLVPSGTADVQRIGQTPLDLERVISYATKDTHLAASSSNFLVSTMLNMPATCRPPKKLKQRRYPKKPNQGQQRKQLQQPKQKQTFQPLTPAQPLQPNQFRRAVAPKKPQQLDATKRLLVSRSGRHNAQGASRNPIRAAA